ncbi:MAG: hypothetical protein HYS12_28490 [Planctomycetes bacterium]|nr:hypothetical protein [Planctomycetota bacterium]
MFSLFRRTKPARKTTRRTSQSFKPFLEALEDRSLLSTVTLGFDSLPSAQGWTYVNGHSISPGYANVPESVFSADGTKLALNDLGYGQAIPHYENRTIGASSEPFAIEARVRVLATEPTFGTESPGIYDVLARINNEFYQIALNKVQVVVYGGTSFSTFALDATQFHTYRLEGIPGQRFTVYVDGNLLTSVAPQPSAGGSNILYLGDGTSFGNCIAELTSFTFTQGATDIAMQSAQLQAGNTVQFTYETTGNPGTFEVGLYRSTDGITYNPADLLSTQTLTPSPTNPQTPGTFQLPTNLASDPALPYLLVVADPSNSITESNEDNNTASILLPDIAMQSAKLASGSSVQFTYDTTGNPGPFQAGLYRSADVIFDASDILIDTQTITPSPTNPQAPGTFTFSALPTTTSQPYLLVVADPASGLSPNGVIQESNEKNNVTLVYPGSADILGTYLQATFPNAHINVNSSQRTIEKQASLMLEQAVNAPQGFLETYHNADYAVEMLKYLDAPIAPNGPTRSEILQGHDSPLKSQVYNDAIGVFESIIVQALKDGHFVSRHLAGYAIDISIPQSDADTIRRLIEAFGGIINDHEPGHGPHWHISYIPPG